MTVLTSESDIEKFIARWTASSGNERANFQSFAIELCEILGVERPHVAGEDGSLNDYTFERKVEFSHLGSTKSTGRIDLYKKDHFLMEAKQSREKGRSKALNLPGQLDLIEPDYFPPIRACRRQKLPDLFLFQRDRRCALEQLAVEAKNPLLDRIKRLVALNKQRSIEEKTGKVRWLRPEYQIPRFGSDAEKARLEEERRRAKEERDRLSPKQGALGFEDELQEMKRRFPTGNELEETVEVMRVLEKAAEPLSLEQIARHFAQGKQIEKRVGLVIAALGRLGHLSSADGGMSASLRSGA